MSVVAFCGVLHRRRTAVQRQRQPARLPQCYAAQHVARQRFPHGVVGGDELQVHRHIAAADHADILHLVPVEPVLVDGAAALLQKLFAQFNGLTLYRAAADGAAQQARLTHQHLGASPAGSGAVVGNDGAQHRIMVLFHLIEQGGENVVHGVLLSGVGV